MIHPLAQVRETPGTLLDRSSYHRDAAAARANPRIRGDVWKLERSQLFREPDDPAWDAYLNRDRDAARKIFESERSAMRRQTLTYRASHLTFRRLRVVEEPRTDYLKWELDGLRVAAEEGADIRLLDAAEVAELERHTMLPEVVVYGQTVLYQVQYDALWTPRGARRITDGRLVREVVDQIEKLAVLSTPLIPA